MWHDLNEIVVIGWRTVTIWWENGVFQCSDRAAQPHGVEFKTLLTDAFHPGLVTRFLLDHPSPCMISWLIRLHDDTACHFAQHVDWQLCDPAPQVNDQKTEHLDHHPICAEERSKVLVVMFGSTYLNDFLAPWHRSFFDYPLKLQQMTGRARFDCTRLLIRILGSNQEHGAA